MVYNKIIIGSSPICLIEALEHQNHQGTLIIDKANGLGGAWKPLEEDGSGIANVESGCHIIEKDKLVFRFFEQKLGLNLIKLEPQPKIIVGKRTLAYHLKNNVSLFKDFKVYFQRERGWSTFKKNNSLFFKNFLQMRMRYYTFKNDSLELVQKLGSLVKEKDINIKLNTTVKKVVVCADTNNVQVTTNSGELINTKKIIITSATKLQELIVNGIDHTCLLENHHLQFVHLHLVVKTNYLKPFSYLRMYKNKLVHRISNMSKQLKLDNDTYLLCVGLHAGCYNQNHKEFIKASVMQLFQDLNLIGDQFEVLNERWSVYSMQNTPIKILEELSQKSNGLIKVIRTTNITTGLRDRIKENALS